MSDILFIPNNITIYEIQLVMIFVVLISQL